MQIGHPVAAEVLASADFEWICVDAEHTDIIVETVSNIFRAFSNTKAVPVVRVSQNSTIEIRQMLDAGAQGIIVPMVNTRKDAEKAVAAAKYPPRGVRGFGYCRANQHGANFDNYISEANDNIFIVAQIEHIEGVKNIDAILDVDGIDGAFVGPYDLSGSLDIPGKLDDPRVQKALEDVIAACQKANKSAGLHVVAPDSEKIAEAIKKGFTFLALSVDTLFMTQCANECITKAHSVLKHIDSTGCVSLCP
ncbi:HpcH/HpaI aldolase family protein [Poriferisphaera sp. WC338]|uniref:HpcH/HpaI aldolase family protein n=1 Tax=Poriferisphaera sp. WC338 TaxID=3425129 RepID=UPI003D81381A